MSIRLNLFSSLRVEKFEQEQTRRQERDNIQCENSQIQTEGASSDGKSEKKNGTLKNDRGWIVATDESGDDAWLPFNPGNRAL